MGRPRRSSRSPCSTSATGRAARTRRASWRSAPASPAMFCASTSASRRRRSGVPQLWFHTGDAAVRDASGTFFFVDRVGDRIRRRGENISSFHVEDLMNQHPDVALSAAFPVPAAEGDEDEVVVYVQPEPGRTLDLDALPAWLEHRLPALHAPAARARGRGDPADADEQGREVPAQAAVPRAGLTRRGHRSASTGAPAVPPRLRRLRAAGSARAGCGGRALRELGEHLLRVLAQRRHDLTPW